MCLLRLTLVLSCCLLCIQSQAQSGRNQPTSNINQDQIYFSDNRPVAKFEKTTVVVQKSVDPQNVQQDSYSQAALGIKDLGPYGVIPLPQTSESKLELPSQNIQPPKLDQKYQNYYTAHSENDAVNIRQADEVAGTEAPFAGPLAPTLTNVSLAVSNFGINLLKNIKQRQGNLVISPFSIAELLALLQQGALGETQQQISEALQMTPQTSAEAFTKLNYNFLKKNSRNILRVANNLYVADVFELSPAFKRVAMHSFGSEVTPMRFARSQEAVRNINSWVAQNTNNKITELLNEDAVNENTQLVMVNAVYFKGLWAIKFKPESTFPRDFFVNDVTKKAVPFMRIRKIFRAGTDPTNLAQVIILPFENEQYSLMVIVPSPVSTLDALVSTLSTAQLASYFTYTPKEVDLQIPKFTVRADTDLNQVFRKIGISNVFGSKSELSGLGTYRTYSPQLSSALHTAMLSIDEEGGSAAAATSFAVVALSYDDPSVVIKANRPFLTVLWDHASTVPLFMARIQDPTF